MSALPERVRAMDVCDILDQAVALYRENFVALLGIYALGYTPFWLLMGLGAHYISGFAMRMAAMAETEAMPSPDEVLGSMLGFMVVGMVIFGTVLIVEPIVTGAIARAVSERVLGRATSIRSAYAALRGRVGALLLSSFVRMIAVYGGYNIASLLAFLAGMPLMIVSPTGGLVVMLVLQLGALLGGSLVFIYMAFLGQIIAIERQGTGGALARSWRLVKGRLWRTSAIAGLVVLLVTALTLAFQVPAFVALGMWAPGGHTPEGAAVLAILIMVVTAVTSLLAAPLLAIGATLMYYDLRVRREGFDVQMMAAALARREATA
jgi:hypothetical protein